MRYSMYDVHVVSRIFAAEKAKMNLKLVRKIMLQVKSFEILPYIGLIYFGFTSRYICNRLILS